HGRDSSRLLTNCHHDTASTAAKVWTRMAVESPRRLVPEERRKQLVEVALELFARRNRNDVGLDDVAERAGVRRSLLYRYFPRGKDALSLAVVEEAWSRMVDLIDTDPDRPLKSKLPENVATFVTLADKGDPALRVLAKARRVDEPRVMRVTRDARREW